MTGMLLNLRIMIYFRRRQVVERLSNSESSNMREWANKLKNYYEQYEAAMEVQITLSLIILK